MKGNDWLKPLKRAQGPHMTVEPMMMMMIGNQSCYGLTCTSHRVPLSYGVRLVCAVESVLVSDMRFS
jgi:hypothetical protein